MAEQSEMWEHWKSPIIFTSYLEGTLKFDFIRCLRENLKRRGVRFDKFPTDIDVLKQAKEYMNNEDLSQEIRKQLMIRAESCCNKWSMCFCCKHYDVLDDSSSDDDYDYEESEEDINFNRKCGFTRTLTNCKSGIKKRYYKQ